MTQPLPVGSAAAASTVPAPTVAEPQCALHSAHTVTRSRQLEEPKSAALGAVGEVRMVLVAHVVLKRGLKREALKKGAPKSDECDVCRSCSYVS